MAREAAFPLADVGLSRRLERAEAETGARFVEARARVFPESGAGWIEVAGAHALFDTPSSPVTQSFGLGLFANVARAEMERCERFFHERGAPVFHEVSPLADPSLLALLNERGYRPEEFTSVMYRPIAADLTLTRARNERIQVRRVGEDEPDLWADIAARGWSELPDLADFLREVGQINAQRRIKWRLPQPR
jgi:hypothetical protein